MFSRSTEYAIRAVVYLAMKSSEDKRFGIKTIAEDLGLPEPYLAKVLQHLVRNRIIYSAKGPNGGFYADEQTRNISLLGIVEANEGLVFFKRCGLGLNDCNEDKPCPIHDEYGKLRDGFYKSLAAKKINHVIEDLNEGKTFVDFLS
ncbi:MAG: transcriptional regulator [Bacteroidetes bacterium]|nr:MAG: transcriptional regulator [Bacteroidota bacterium]RLD84948.1 MAG: transcriptional regulator [Bacteroidota bacterium]